MKEHHRDVEEILKEFPENIAKLVNDLQQEKSTVLRIEAKNKLEKMGRRILPYLNRLLLTNNDALRRESARIMEFIADRTSIPVFLRLLEDSDHGIRWTAAEGLVRIGRDSIVPLLRAILDDKNGSYFLRLGAHHAFERLFTDKEKVTLRALLLSLKNYLGIGETVSLEALNALKAFGHNIHGGG